MAWRRLGQVLVFIIGCSKLLLASASNTLSEWGAYLARLCDDLGSLSKRRTVSRLAQSFRLIRLESQRHALLAVRRLGNGLFSSQHVELCLICKAFLERDIAWRINELFNVYFRVEAKTPVLLATCIDTRCSVTFALPIKNVVDMLVLELDFFLTRLDYCLLLVVI